ncbi:MAG: hypothetical protein C4523_20405 [Myxococcales bacterium]|nr:MAG: hypothetical protein C4523_20405 [Myxococcales bacterium]
MRGSSVRWANLIFAAGLLASLSGCGFVEEAVSDVKSWFGLAESAPVPEPVASPSAAPEPPAAPPPTAVPAGPFPAGDLVIGWSSDGRFFAYRERTAIEGGEIFYRLRIVNTLIGQATGGRAGAFAVGSGSVSPPPGGDAEQAVLERFWQDARPLLDRYGFPAETQLGTALIQRPSPEGTADEKSFIASETLPLAIPGFSEAALSLKATIRPFSSSAPHEIAYTRDGALAMAFAGKTLADETAPARDVERELLAGDAFEAGVHGFVLRGVYLSPDGERLAVLYEPHTKDRWNGQPPGRIALLGAAAKIGGADVNQMQRMLRGREEKAGPALQERLENKLKRKGRSGATREVERPDPAAEPGRGDGKKQPSRPSRPRSGDR